MGCWNETCLMSNLPIRAGDPVVAFLVAQENNKNTSTVGGSFSSTDFIFPVSLPIIAEYDDYGSIENYKNNYFAEQHISKLFKKSLDNILDLLKNNKFTEDNNSVGLVMFHRKLYDLSKNNISSEYYEVAKEKIKSGIEKIVNTKVKNKYTDAWNDRAIFVGDLSYALSADGSERKDAFTVSSLIDFILDEVELMPHIKNKSLDEFSSLCAERVAISRTLNVLRKTWIPASGKGSQSEGIRAHILLANSIKEVILENKNDDDVMSLYGSFLHNYYD